MPKQKRKPTKRKPKQPTVGRWGRYFITMAIYRATGKVTGPV